MAQVYHVVFHDDVDGIVSAAIFLHNHVRGSTYRLYPVSSSCRGERFSLMIKNMNLDDDKDILIILDFENHPRSNLWIDHHYNSAIGDHEVRNSKVVYNPDSKSTSRLVQSIPWRLAAVGSYPSNFLNTIDVINQVGFRSVNQLFKDTSPVMIIRAFLEKGFISDMVFSRIVEMIAKTHFDFKRAAFQMRLDRDIVYSLEEEAKKTGKVMTVSGNFSIITQRRVRQYPRYSEFYVRPETKYSLRLTAAGRNRVYIQLGYNRWHKEANEINIGKTLSKLSYLIRGNGHYGVGGGVMKESNSNRLIDDLAIILNKEEPLEKFGVDQNDPVEKKAESMIKTGEEKTIDAAREKALKEETKKKETDKNADNGD